MRKYLFATIAVLATLSVACKGKEGEHKAGAKEDKGTTAKKPVDAPPAAPPAAKLSYKKLGTLGLEAEVADDANIEDNSSGAGFPMATIYATPTIFVMGTGDMSSVKKTIEETKTELGKDPNKLKAITKEEKTADGWSIEVTREALMGGELLGLSVRRTFGDKAFDCGTNVKTKDELEKARKFCASLRPAK